MKYKKRSKEKFPGADIVLSIYLCIMLGFFPLHYKFQYNGMGDAKYAVFSKATLSCLILLLLILGISLAVEINRVGISRWAENIKWEFSLLDKGVLLYFICTTISFLCSPFKGDILWGASGWDMGYVSQVLFVALYFFISRMGKFQEWYLWILMITSGFAFLVAILQRFSIDIIGVYGQLDLYYKTQFLSTMGQASWYSSFLCTVFPVGLYFFYTAKKRKLRIATGIYSVLAMCSLVTQNTDSAYLALMGVLVLFYYLSFDGEKERARFYEVILLIFGSFTTIGILQKIFAEYVIPIDSLSIFMSQGFLSPCVCVVTIGLYMLCKKKKRYFLFTVKKNGSQTQPSRVPFWILVSIIGVGILFVLMFIILNTNGFLNAQFGYQSSNNYLFFDNEWGNKRGFAWSYTCEVFREMPLIQKLIGVGPDGYSFYAKSVPLLAEKMRGYWGDIILTNSHNEYLTKLVNAGVAGLFSYLFMLGSAVSLFVKNRKTHILLPAFALCTVAYMAHNIFCYEQVCCTPFFYIILGFGGNLIYNKMNKSAY